MRRKRRANDFYPTPAHATEALLRYVVIAGTVLECCSGQDDITSVLKRKGLNVTTNDIDPAMPADTHEDATKDPFWADKYPDWVISNPPFSVAPPIVERAYSAARWGSAMLLRLSYLEPCKNRAEWLSAHKPTHLIVLPRISFTGDGKTDNVTCAWFVWQKFAVVQNVIVVTKSEIGSY